MRTRLRPLTVAATLVVAVALLAAAAMVSPRTRVANNALYQEGVALAPDGTPTIVATGSRPTLLPGSRVIDPGPGEQQQSALDRAAASRQWLAQGSIPGADHGYTELATTALLDLRTLTGPDGGLIAGPSPNWRYVWPRDASFVAAAYVVTGHLDDAVALLTFLQNVQAEDGSFHARYLPDGSGVPDARGLQTDGTGWVLWALDRVLAAAGPAAPAPADPVEPTGPAPATEPAPSADSLREHFTPMLERSTSYLREQTQTRTGLPAPSADYWERPESRTTLGTAAPVLAGFEAAARIYQRAGDEATAHGLNRRSDALREAISNEFGRYGYGRYPHRSAADAARAFTLPPFLAEPLPGALSAWRASIAQMQRPGGGLAPGAQWHEPSMSWTPETALYAWTAAANGQDDLAWQWIDWIASHRTAIGAIPEKVGPDGAPAHVAPLAWSCALTVLTLAELDRPT